MKHHSDKSLVSGGKGAKPRESERTDTSVREMRAWVEDLEKGAEAPKILVHTFHFMEVDVRAIRESLSMSRQEFATAFGLSFRTIENWEDGRREPEGPAKSYLVAIAFAPEAVAQAIKDYRDGKLPARSAGRAAGGASGGQGQRDTGRLARRASEPASNALEHA